MSLVLMNRIAELVFVAVDVLCPVFAVFASVNPALIELGFDDEDSLDEYYDMVYLRAVAVACEQKVIYYFVSVHWKLFQNRCHPHFPNFAFGWQKAEEKYNYQDADYYR